MSKKFIDFTEMASLTSIMQMFDRPQSQGSRGKGQNRNSCLKEHERAARRKRNKVQKKARKRNRRKK